MAAGSAWAPVSVMRNAPIRPRLAVGSAFVIRGLQPMACPDLPALWEFGSRN